MNLQGRKEKGKLKLRDLDQNQFQVYFEPFKEGTWFNIHITKAQKPKTLEQLGYYHAVIIPTVNLALIEHGYTMTVFGAEVPIDKKQTDKLIKYFCARLDDEGNLQIHDPTNYPFRKVMDKRNMSRQQVSQLIDNAIKWANSVLRCQVPEPTKT